MPLKLDGYTLVLTNELALENEQAGETFDSPVNNFAIAGSLGYLTQQFAYSDQWSDWHPQPGGILHTLVPQ